MIVTYLLKIGGNLYLHIIGNGFVAFDTLVLALKLFLILLVGKRARHAKHALHALGKMDNLFLCLHDGYFGRCHYAAIDKVQGGVGFGKLAVGQQTAHDALHLRDETDEQSGIKHIETCMEHGQYHRQKRCL